MKILLNLLVISFTSFFALNSFAGNEVLNVKQDTANTTLEEKDVSRFTDAIALINEYYVKPINEKQLLDNAIRGVIAGLDPHSEYLDENAYKALLLANNAAFNNTIGIDVTSEYDVLKVISPIDGTPAAKAGEKVEITLLLRMIN